MQRREFITLLGGATAAWPLAAHGQQGGRMRHIGALLPFSAEDAEGKTIVTALRQGLEKFDWIEDRYSDRLSLWWRRCCAYASLREGTRRIVA